MLLVLNNILFYSIFLNKDFGFETCE